MIVLPHSRMVAFGRVLRTGLSRLRRLAASRLSPTGFNPSRECVA
jgi:hypothetical protein